MKPFCANEKIIIKDGKECIICDDTRSKLLPLLQQTQEEKGFISDDDMQDIADKLGIHPVEVYSVVTFYSFFTYNKKGKNIIRVSTCPTSFIKGADAVIEAFEKKLGIKTGETTPDGKFTLEKTACIGMCDHTPAIMVNDKLIGDVAPEKVEDIISSIEK